MANNSTLNTLTCLLCGYNSLEKCSYLSFPTNENKRKLWLQKCELPDTLDVSCSRLCSKHFQPEDYSETAVCNRLKSGAFPSIFFNRVPKNEQEREQWIQHFKLDPNADFTKGRLCGKHFQVENYDSETQLHRILKKRPLKNSNSASRQLGAEYTEHTTEGTSTKYGRICVICGLQNDNVKAYRFPKKECTRENWASSLNLDLSSINIAAAFVYEFHFRPDDFGNTEKRRRLRDTALPLLSVVKNERSGVESGDVTSEHSSADNVHQSTSTPMPVSDLHGLWSSSNPLSSVGMPAIAGTPESSTSNTLSQYHPSNSTTPNMPLSRQQHSMSGVKASRIPRYPGDTKSPDVATPRRAKRCLQITTAYIWRQKRKLSSTQQQLRRAKQRIKTLEDIISNLHDRHLITGDITERLMETIPPSVAQMGIHAMEGRRSKYSPCLRTFALTLQFYSTKAYQYVRRMWNNLLPHPATLRKWSCNVDGLPGFSKDVLQTIANRGKYSEKPTICNLVIDEMAIRRKVVSNNDKFYGFVDVGVNPESEILEGDDDSSNVEMQARNPDSESQPTATQALVFLLVALNEGWKAPCGYFLIDTLTSEQKAELVNRGLCMCADFNINVHSITFDGMRSNFTMAKELGANVDVDSEQFRPWFPHPKNKHKVYLLPDPSHMIKNVRNAFPQSDTYDKKGIKMFLFDNNQNEIKWTYIRKLIELQASEGLRAGNKLTQQHLRFYEKKMNVRLAVQTLSTSTADALKYCEKKGKVGFENVDATANFCKKFNDIFDMFNCRTHFTNTYETHKIPLTEKTVPKLQAYAVDFIAYIRGLTYNSRPITKSERKCGFSGFIICLTNLFPLYNDLKETYGLKYMLSYKLLQDHLENFFSAVRMKGGFNNNPDAFQFMCAYRRLLIHHQVVSSESANCPPDHIKILNVSSCTKIKKDSEVLLNYEVFDFSDIEDIPSEFVDDVVAYIGGYIVFKILKNKYADICGTCKSLLKDEDGSSLLIDVKTRGGLQMPSNAVKDICRELEKYIRHNNDLIFKPMFVDACITQILEKFPLDGHEHVNSLLKLICQYYLRTRLRHEAAILSELEKNIRRIYTKLITHKHQ